MKEKKLSAALICHLVIMALLCVVSIISAVIIFTGNIPSGFETSAEIYKTTTTLYGVAHVMNALALICGIIYLVMGSGKNVSFLYKTFILLVMIGVGLRLSGTMVHPGFGAAACIMIAIILSLFILTFIKNLGKTKTMIFFYILLALEIALGIIMFDKNEVLSSIVGELSRLVLIGTIGIAITAKYADKAARGRKV